MATTNKSAPIQEAVILKQRYEGRCGGGEALQTAEQEEPEEETWHL